jgi:hypothetical protein
MDSAMRWEFPVVAFLKWNVGRRLAGQSFLLVLEFFGGSLN